MDDMSVLAGLVLFVFSLLFFIKPGRKTKGQTSNQARAKASGPARRRPREIVPPVGRDDSLAEPSVQTVRVVNVIDGDTAIVANGWRKFRVRLDGIDCPEDGQPWGGTARAGLIKLIGGRRVRLESHGVDDYGRVIGTLYAWHRGKGWVNVNARMVTLGHAWVLRRYVSHLTIARREELFRVERWARSKRVGLWRDADPVPPWEWRTNGGEAERG